MKDPDPFVEDRGIMTKEPMVDYSWVLHRWIPKGSRPDHNGNGGFAFSTTWNEVGDQIEFVVPVRIGSGFTVTTQMPRLETKAGKEAFRKQVCDTLDRLIDYMVTKIQQGKIELMEPELDRQIEARIGMERKA